MVASHVFRPRSRPWQYRRRRFFRRSSDASDAPPPRVDGGCACFAYGRIAEERKSPERSILTIEIERRWFVRRWIPISNLGRVILTLPLRWGPRLSIKTSFIPVALSSFGTRIALFLDGKSIRQSTPPELRSRCSTWDGAG